MKKISSLLLFQFFLTFFCYGQCTIRGKVIDDAGDPAIGATVFLKAKPATGTSTDLDGNYTLTIKDTTPQILVVSYISFQNQEEKFIPVKGKVIVKDFKLKAMAQEMEEVTIEAKENKGSVNYTDKMKINSLTSIDVISSNLLKKTGDAAVVNAVARVSGVSTNGGFITVRGIGDRYVKTTMNGSRIPTLDPFTNNIRLDLFPASLVDNIMLTKTASAELPGDWAGAYLSIQTKDYPDKLTVNIESAFGYNNQSTFKDIIGSQRSKTDWLGYDNSLRVHKHTDFTGVTTAPTTYQELVALGLGAYYASLGINQQNWGEGTVTGETYFRLGLVELGLLNKGLINDANAVALAKSKYENGNYKYTAFNTINADAVKTGQSFANNWNTTTYKAPINYTQSFSIGNQVNLFKRPLGYIIGFRYGNNIQFDENSAVNRAGVSYAPDGSIEKSITAQMKQQISRETNGWSALMNLAYKAGKNNSFSLLFMPNLTGVNNARNSVDNREASNFVITKSQFYEQRKQLIYQYKSEHLLPRPNIKFELNASYTNGKSSAPDFKNLQYLQDPISNTNQIGGAIGDGMHRYFRYLSDNLFDSRLLVDIPIGTVSKLSRKLKIGAAYQRNDKKSQLYDYAAFIAPNSNLTLTNNNLDAFFDLSHFSLHDYKDQNNHTRSTMDLYYTSSTSPANNTFGNSTIAATFIMTDYAITPRLRASGGLRIEKATIYTDVVLYDSLHYPANDIRRNYSTSMPAARPGVLNETSYLPSFNFVYKLKNHETNPINLRANYSKTVARPSIRELSDIAVIDYEYRAFVFGNSDLKMAKIDNYDLRTEIYFKSGDNLSFSAFHKDFRNHIELVNSNGYTWQNVDKSYVSGIELEGKKLLGKHFEFRANVTFAQSKTQFILSRMEIAEGIKKYYPIGPVSRPMFGQSPYVFNAMFTYTNDSIGLTATVAYNVQGPRLVIAAEVQEIPDIYELARNLIDLKLSKTVGKHFTIGVVVRDLLNAPIRRSYNYKEGWILDYDKFRFGTIYQLSISYKL